MSKYNLEDLLNEYIGGGRIGTLKISFKDLQDKMDELENSDKVIVRTLSGPSGDGKVNREFEVVDRDSAVAGGGKQERGFTVYDYKFGFDPGSEEHFMEEYPFSVGGNDLKLAMELIDGVEAGISEEKDDKKELPQSIKDKEARDAEIEAKKAKGMMKEANEDYDLLKIKKEIRFHLDTYEKGIIDGDDLAQAVEEVVFGEIKAPGMRENGHVDDYAEEIAEADVDVDLVKATAAKANNQINNAAGMADFILDVIAQIGEKEQEGILNNNNIKQAVAFLEKAKDQVKEGHAMQGVEAELESGEIGNMDALTEETAPTGIGISGDQLKDLIKLGAIAGVEVYVRDKDGKNVRTVDYTLTNTDFEKDPDDIDYIDENEGQEALKEHFSRFMFKKYS